MSESIAQAHLLPVVEAVRQFGGSHPGVVQQIWFEHSPERVVVLLIRDDAPTHEAALRAIAMPEDLEIRYSPWPPGHLERIRGEIMDSARGSFSGMGTGKGILSVRLWADQIEAAATLHQRYGEAVVLQVGFLPYPDLGADNATAVASFGETPELPALAPEVALSLEEGFEIRSGSHVSSDLTIRNDSRLELVAGKLVPSMVDPTSRRVVGGFEGAITMEMRRYKVPAGTSTSIPVLIGTASTRAELGWAVPNGTWAIRIQLQQGAEGCERVVPIEIVP